MMEANKIKEAKARVQSILDTAPPSRWWDIQKVTIQFVKTTRRNSWNQYANGLVVRVATKGNYHSFEVEQYYTKLLTSNSVTIRSVRKSEKLRKGSGYMSVLGTREYASVERETISFYVTLPEAAQS